MAPFLLGMTPLLLLSGCDQIEEMTGISLGGAKDPAEIVSSARDSLDAGDLPGAHDEYKALADKHADVVEVHTGLAYMQLLAGDYGAADKTLADALTIEGLDEAAKAEINLRRAIVALREGNLGNIQKYAEASGLPAGKVLAAEVYLADAETDSAIPLLEDAASAGGAVGQAASTYLDYLNDAETGRAQLAEATALWALGQREEACETAEELLKFLPVDYSARDELLLLWAGRSVASGRPAVAEGLLDEMGGAPDGQVWRVQATRALIAVAKEDYETAKATLTALGEGGAPADGLADALATAAAISGDAEFAREIASGVKSNAIARGLQAAGATAAAKDAVPSGTYSRYLESL